MNGGDGSVSAFRVSAPQRLLEDRLANPLLCRLLRSRVRWPASRWLMLVSYEGRRSGRRYTFPVAYERVGGGVVAVTPGAESDWWRNFRSPYGCEVWFRGAAREATGEVVTGAERHQLLARYRRGHPLLGRMLGASAGQTGDSTRSDDSHQWDESTRSDEPTRNDEPIRNPSPGLVVVRFAFESSD